MRAGRILEPGSPKTVSSTSLPSLEHRTLLYPRPRPTDLSQSHSIPPKSRKGKEKEHRESDNEYIPGDDEMSDDQHLAFGKNQGPEKASIQKEVVSEDEVIDKEGESQVAN